MLYRYETHCHCSQASACAKSHSRELVQAYYQAGYAGLVLTDHFIYGNTAVNRNLPWKERMQQYNNAYLEAKTAAKGLDFDVIFGIEHAYGDGKEVLIYGIGLDFLLVNPDIPRLSLEELVERVHEASGVVIQAHPYRNRHYINMAVEPRWDLVDGFELYNACSAPGEDLLALPYAQNPNYILTSGGDIHHVADSRIGHAGIVLPHRVTNEREFAAALKKRQHHLMVKGQIVTEVTNEMLTSQL